MNKLLRKYPSLFGLFFLFLMVSIPVVNALSSVSDSFNNSSKVSGTYQTVVTGGHVELEKYTDLLELLGYQSVRKITVDHNDVDEVLTDFPILVHLNSSNIDWSKVQDDLDDLRFTQDNSTLLMAELDHYVTNTEAWIWVKIPSISNLTDTELFMFYNNATVSSYWNPEAVWDANYVMVQHMKDATTSTILDSTSNNNDGTKKGTNEPIETASGKIDDAQDFDGTNDYVKVLDNNSLDLISAITLVTWVKRGTATGQLECVIAKGLYGSDSRGDYLLFQLNDVLYGGIVTENGNQRVENGVFSEIGVWTQLAMVYDGSTVKLYKNGVQTGTTKNVVGTLVANAHDVLVGTLGYNSNEGFLSGIIDEVHISNVSRSVAWIISSYENERDHLLSYGSEVNQQTVYYSNGLLYSINLLFATSSSKIDSFIYNSTITNPGTIKIQFSENNATWQNQYGVSNAWTSLATGQHILDMFNLEWSNHFYYRINMTQTSSTVSPYLNEISVYYLADSTPTGTIQAIFSELFYGSGSWLGLLILLIFIVALSLAQQYLGLLMLPVAIYLAIEYLSYPALMWNALIMFLASIFIVINLVRGRND